MHKHTHNVQQLNLTYPWLQSDRNSMQTLHRCRAPIILLLISEYLNKQKTGFKAATSLKFTGRLITKEQLLTGEITGKRAKKHNYVITEFTGYKCKQ